MKIAGNAVSMFLFVILVSGTLSTFANVPLMKTSVIPSDKQSLENSFSLDLPSLKMPLKKFIDPELLNSVGLERVIVTVMDDVALNDVSEYMISARTTPSFKDFRIVRGLMSSENIMKLAADSRVLSILKDKRINYDMPIEFPTFSSLQDMLKFRFQNPQFEERTLNKPETTLKDVVKITGAKKTWETYSINGTDTTIAIVDTGVDYGAPSLGYSDAVARDSLGYPATFDADAESMVITNTIVTNTFTVTGSDTWLETNGTDPYLYYSFFASAPYYLVPPVVRWSELDHNIFPFPMNEAFFPFAMNITGIESKSGNYHFGLMFQYLFGLDLFPVLVVDPVTEGVYDTVYVDISFDWGLLNAILPPPYNSFFGTWPPELSFVDETPVTLTGRTVGSRDFTGDGIYDISVGSLGYFLDVWTASPNLEDRGQVLKPIAPDGDYAVFVNDWWGHGTNCASSAAGRGLSIPFINSGMAPGAKIMGIVALFMGDVIEADLWAAGFDLVPGSEEWRNVTGYGTTWGTWTYTGNHKADVISHSWGLSDWAEFTQGMPWYDVLTVFEDALTVPGYFAPGYLGTVIVHAGGNGAAGYGTVTEPAYATLPITVGASTSMNWTQIAFGFAGGSYDEAIPWSARGPTPLGNVKPDVVNIGARGWTAGPVWYGLGNGSLAYELFGGTSMAAPLTAGASALTIQAYNQKYGGKPSPELTKVVLKSSAKDLGYDAFVQGSGRVDAFAAVELAFAMSGVTVTSSAAWENIYPKIVDAWATSYRSLGGPLSFEPPATPINDVNWFAGTITPGESATTEFTIENTVNQSAIATITPVTHEQIGPSLTYSGNTGMMPFDWLMWWSPMLPDGWSWGNLTILDLSDIPSETELMVASLRVPYGYFDENADHIFDRRWGLGILDWIDANGDGNVNVNEVYMLNYGYNFGTTNEARVSFPLSKIKGKPVIFIYQSGDLDAVPFTVSISFYERKNWTWVETPTSISISGKSFKLFTANLNVPTNAAQGVYEGQLIINITAPYNKTIAVPVSLQVSAILSPGNLVYNFTPPSTGSLYDSFKVRGYFDWGWRYESGDWKQWIFNLQDSAVVAAFVSSSWTGSMTDIDMFAINPMGIMIDGAVSPNLGDGVFQWQTRTGNNTEYVVLNTSNFAYSQPGIYTVLLHNVLFDGTIYPENVTGRVELVKLFPRGPVNVVARSDQLVSQKFTIMSGRGLTNIRFRAYTDLSPFPVEFTPDNITYIDALGSVEFTVRIDVPSDIPEGIYPSCFLFQANELPFPVLVLVNVVVDNTSPTVTIVSPKNGINVNGNITIKAYASDTNEVGGMEFEVGTTSATMTFDNATGHWIASLDTITLRDGLNTIKVKATDKAGNVGSTSVAVKVDNTGPFANIGAPTSGSYLRGTTEITVTGQDANLNRTELYLNGRLKATWNVNGTSTYLWNTTALIDGEYSITLKVYDNVNNFATDEISATLDNTSPSVSIIKPQSGDELSGTITMNFVAADTNLESVQLSIDQSTFKVTGATSYQWNTTSVVDGTHFIGLMAHDKAGNVASTSIAVKIDNTKPLASIDAPANNSYLHGTTKINVTGQDANFNKTELYINGRLERTWNVSGTNTYQWNITVLANGAYMITLKVYDTANNFATDEISVTVDNTPPIAEIRTPATLDYVKGNYNITVFAYDANLQSIQLSVDGSSLTSWTINGVHSFIWNTSSINGPRTIMIGVYDKAGTKTERTVVVTVDNTLPTVSITKPQNVAELSGTTSINFTASDTNLKSTQLFIDQSTFNVTGATSYQWDTTKVGDGIHVIKLKAYDKAGNTNEFSVSVSTANSRLNLEANKNLYLVIGTPLGFVLGVLIAYIILKRKK